MTKPWSGWAVALNRRYLAFRPDRMWLFGVLSIGFITLMAVTSVSTFIVSARHRIQLIAYRDLTRDMRLFQLALTEAEAGLLGFRLTHGVDRLQRYFAGVALLDTVGARALTRLDEEAAALALGDPHALSRRIGVVKASWAQLLASGEAGADAAGRPPGSAAEPALAELRALLNTAIDHRNARADRSDAVLAEQRKVLFGIDVSSALLTTATLLVFFRRTLRETRRREAVIADAAVATRRAEQLFGMASALQSASDRTDANEVLVATAVRLMPGHGGLLYMLNGSQDRLELAASWGSAPAAAPPQEIAPLGCWAMKSGKPHLNGEAAGTLRCAHLGGAVAPVLEVPIAARGQVFGLLTVGPGDHDAAVLRKIQPVAGALADAMSLALSSIALRELLRNQALRDALTGLYNRRFLDEMLEHLSLDARRRQAPLSAIMIDLDYFKALNDQYGHAAGDTVLRSVAATMLEGLRATDVACRYGGEELAILLPDCPLEMAAFKAEQLRARIAELAGEPGGARVTASLGVAAMPETSDSAAGLMVHADAALYQAKLAGRNRVVQAARVGSEEMVRLEALGALR
jgi:diguanylate cyclase (GGDEF)-like protein